MSRILVHDEEAMRMPGGVGFIDATDVLERGTEDMDVGAILSMPDFELNDAMSALEIMDSRMDSGMTEQPPPFDPNMPLLPSEVCWILDRTFACEMGWHSGLSLSQSIYTLRYVHHLGNISLPQFKVDGMTQNTGSSYTLQDPEKPPELVTLVLRAGVFALLKCCDLVWRELAQDHLFDGEDWFGDKYGVSLCENVQAQNIFSLLDEAMIWLHNSPALSSSPWRNPLINRLLMRRNIVQTLSHPSFPMIQSAQENLASILTGPQPPEPSTTLLNVFDRNISRQLVSFLPTRIVELPAQAEVWDTVALWLDQWRGIRQLAGAESLWSVKVLASLKAYEAQPPRRSAFLGSLSIYTFFTGSKILLTHEPPWLIDQFFLETAGIPPGLISMLAEEARHGGNDSSPKDLHAQGQSSNEVPSNSSKGDVKADVEVFEKGIAKLLVDFFTSFYHNRPRQRRKLVASLLDWHLAYEHAQHIATILAPLNPVMSRVPLCIRHIRLSVITEVVLSGFELELYSRHEWIMIYWYLAQILDTQVAVLDELMMSLRQQVDDVDVHQALAHITVQQDYAHALRCFAIAIRDFLYHNRPSKVQMEPAREQANFERRFKWTFISGYSEATTLDEDRPILGKWRRWRNEQDHDDSIASVMDNLMQAREGFSRLSVRKPADTGAIYCEEKYKELMSNLMRACDANLEFLRQPQKAREIKDLQWMWGSPRWFPWIAGS